MLLQQEYKLTPKNCMKLCFPFHLMNYCTSIFKFAIFKFEMIPNYHMPYALLTHAQPVNWDLKSRHQIAGSRKVRSKLER
jgi:hypothetical protein